ncbi:HNH endonuclease [Ferrimicrobium sp.]|uniref:HNH endonuclease n=1 Tax=Ferrimicrobium sp. TaxID=2926050 RepID=UPI0026217917|nr:HNH endonuclease [Ferrimicrobium sp.]
MIRTNSSSKSNSVDYWVGVTDPQWFSFLAEQNIRTEINFWQPTGTPPTSQLQPGSPFLFKLKRPYNHLVGGGTFLSFTTMPIWLAWEIFGEANGFATFEKMLEAFSDSTGECNPQREIGCTTLASPFYLPPDQWIDMDGIWPLSIQRGKGYRFDTPEGTALWSRLDPLMLDETLPVGSEFKPLPHSVEAGSQWSLARHRIGQRGFRVLVMEAYQRRCAITGENTLDVLEAAHIHPFAEDENHDVRNGLLLRADFHRLYDRGLVTVTPDLQIRISPLIQEHYYNGRAYYRLDKARLAVVPENPADRPDPQRLEWHVVNRFIAG